jgi:hypothetical protein
MVGVRGGDPSNGSAWAWGCATLPSPMRRADTAPSPCVGHQFSNKKSRVVTGQVTVGPRTGNLPVEWTPNNGGRHAGIPTPLCTMRARGQPPTSISRVCADDTRNHRSQPQPGLANCPCFSAGAMLHAPRPRRGSSGTAIYLEASIVGAGDRRRGARTTLLPARWSSGGLPLLCRSRWATLVLVLVAMQGALGRPLARVGCLA